MSFFHLVTYCTHMYNNDVLDVLNAHPVLAWTWARINNQFMEFKMLAQ